MTIEYSYLTSSVTNHLNSTWVKTNLNPGVFQIGYWIKAKCIECA